MLDIRQFPCLLDNYGFLVRDAESGRVACIDTPDADAILAQADALGWRIDEIWNTHWHPDHAGGNAAIKAQTGAVVIGPAEVARIGAAPDRIVTHGDTVLLGATAATVVDVGGHTLQHIAYHLAGDGVAFVGDAVFAMGCGRLFEGPPAQMWDSLMRIAAWPDATTLYCAHEYTLSNAAFALSVEPDNAALQARAAWVRAQRAADLPTVPMTVLEERATNPFLRAGGVEEFARRRAAKDMFK
jgi:hydroxyacylglutathione hydrolase